jgi:hypothetical protein
MEIAATVMAAGSIFVVLLIAMYISNWRKSP